MTLVALLYTLAALWLALYGANALWLTALFLHRRRAPTATPPAPPDSALPLVTVQLPLFNEKYVAARLVDAACALNYPRDRLQVQVLDDSTDETVRRVARRVRHWRRQGVNVVQVRRSDRRDFKAGALAHGLEQATGEFVAIFDADFVPKADWLRRTVAPFLQPGWEQVGLLQTRWAHLNEESSPLTRAAALALDGHFAVEQPARAHSGLLFNFNGTGGLWRRACIEASGGWAGHTLCEDMELSYRAQLAGWQLRYDGTIEAPAEVPAQVAAYKRQQFRWAKGSFQVARLMAGPVLRAPLSGHQRLQALLHLTGYAVHPLLVVQLLLTLPLLLWGWPSSLASYGALLLLLMGAGLGAPLLYGVGQWALHGGAWRRRIRWLPLLVLFGTGIALSNARAVAEGLLGPLGSEFRRTPKFGLVGRSGGWRGKDYALPRDPLAWAELGLAAYALLCVGLALWRGQWLAVPFLAIYSAAFGLVGGLTLWDEWGTRAVQRRWLHSGGESPTPS